MAQWFGPKLVGYGVGPRSWQGWLATALVVAAVIGTRFVRPESFGLPGWSKLVFIGVVLAFYLLLIFLTYGNDD